MSNTCVLDKLDIPYKISLYRNGNNPNIYYYFRWKGVKYQGSTGSDNLDMSRKKVNEIFFDLTKGLRQKGRKKTTKFEDIIKDFLNEKGKDENKLSPKTLTEYKRQSKYLLEWFKDQSKGMDVNVFFSQNRYKDYCDWRRDYYKDHDRVQKYKRNGQKIKGRTLQPVGETSLNRECRLLCSVLRHGKQYLSILKDTEIPPYKMFPEKRREELLTHEEYDKLKTYWMNKNKYYWYVFSFLNNTGIRPGELNKIVWSDVNLDKSFVMIRDRKNKNKHTTINTPVPLIGTSREIIEILKSRDGIPKGPDDKVFVNDKNHQIISLNKPFKRSLVECNIDKNLTIYSFRHLFTTRMVKRPDIPIKILSEVLGHTSTDMINKHYSILKAEDYVNVFQESEKHKQEILRDKNNKPSENNGEQNDEWTGFV